MTSKLFYILFFIVFSIGEIKANEQELLSLKVPQKLRKKLKSFEPSSAIYLADENKYLIAVDDTTKNDDPWLFFMNEKGEIEPEPVEIEGVEKITDMESISQDEDGFVYVMSSQGLNKSGKNKTERNLFVKARWDSSHVLASLETVELRPFLIEALLSSQDPILKKMRSKYEALLDIEAHFILNGELFVGLKEPQFEKSKAVILNLGSVKNAFAGQISLSLSQVIDLRTDQGTRSMLSELAWSGNQLWATSTTDDGQGQLWSINDQNTALEYEFDARPEGLTFKNSSAMILFDQGTDGDGMFWSFHAL